MDIGSSLQKLYIIFEESKKNLEIYSSKYKAAEQSKLIEISLKKSGDGLCPSEEVEKNQKTIKRLNNKLAEILKNTKSNALEQLPLVHNTSLKIILTEQNSVDPVVKINDELIFYYIRHFNIEEDYYSSVVENLNKLNALTINIKTTIREIEKIQNSSNKDIVPQPFRPQSIRFKNAHLYIDDYKIRFRKGSLGSYMLKAVFNNKDTEDGANATDIFELENSSEATSREAGKKERHKYLATRERINKRITKETGIKDDFILVNNTNYSINKDFGL